MKKLAASILSSDFGRLSEEVKAVELAGADWIHVDVMDGHFVPNITVGPSVVRAIRNTTSLPLDVHLMIEKPEKYIEVFADAGADWLNVHVEATVHLHRVIQRIKELGVKASVALNPATPLDNVRCVLSDLDMILVMTVNPGFGGQGFITECLPKIQQAADWRSKLGLNFRIAVDGGVDFQTAASCASAGADTFISGTTLFEHKNLKAAVAKMRKAAQSHAAPQVSLLQ